MEILVKHKHFKQADNFGNAFRCPLAMAIREEMGVDVMVLFDWVEIDGKRYNIVGGYHHDADRYQSGKFKGNNMNDLIGYAKRNPLSLLFKIPIKKIELVADES